MNPLEFTAAAEADLDELWLHIAKDSPTQADRVVTAIHGACTSLLDMPMIGRSREEFRPDLRSWPVYSWLVFYIPRQDGILIYRVVHGAKDLPQVFA